MFELADGVSASKTVFSHTDEARHRRQAERVIGSVPLQERLSSAKTSNGRPTATRGGGADDGSGSGDLNKVRYVRTEEEGLVRAMSYIPREHAHAGKGEDKLARAAAASSASGGGGGGDKGGSGKAGKGGKGKKAPRMDEREAFFVR
jgi:hypothetical protein